MTAPELTKELNSSLEFFERSSRCLVEEDSGFCPADGMMTVAQQMAHVGQTIDWFVEGASRPEGFDLDFEKHMAAVAAVNSVEEARAWVRRAFQVAIRFVESRSDRKLEIALPPGPVMGGEPVWHIVPAIVEHTAHHRGALTVYSRLRSKVPVMPYGEM